jgi:hypothetical protein
MQEISPGGGVKNKEYLFIGSKVFPDIPGDCRD